MTRTTTTTGRHVGDRGPQGPENRWSDYVRTRRKGAKHAHVAVLWSEIDESARVVMRPK